MTQEAPEPVEVDCTFDTNGRVRVRRVRVAGVWLPADQGRQGEDEYGRFVLVMLADRPPRVLRLDRSTLRWTLSALPGAENWDVI